MSYVSCLSFCVKSQFSPFRNLSLTAAIGAIGAIATATAAHAHPISACDTPVRARTFVQIDEAQTIGGRWSPIPYGCYMTKRMKRPAPAFINYETSIISLACYIKEHRKSLVNGETSYDPEDIQRTIDAATARAEIIAAAKVCRSAKLFKRSANNGPRIEKLPDPDADYDDYDDYNDDDGDGGDGGESGGRGSWTCFAVGSHEECFRHPGTSFDHCYQKTFRDQGLAARRDIAEMFAMDRCDKQRRDAAFNAQAILGDTIKNSSRCVVTKCVEN